MKAFFKTEFFNSHGCYRHLLAFWLCFWVYLLFDSELSFHCLSVSVHPAVGERAFCSFLTRRVSDGESVLFVCAVQVGSDR
jgi:hypothetical protein